MRDEAGLPVKRDTLWGRCLRSLERFEAAMDLTLDDLQDHRLDRVESELAHIKSELSKIAAAMRAR